MNLFGYPVKFLFTLLLAWYSVHYTNGSNGTKNILFDSYDVKFYFIDVEANNLNTDIIGNTQILIQLKEPDIDTIGLELSKLAKVDSILINEEHLIFNRNEDTLKIALPKGGEVGAYYTLKIYYEFTGENTGSRKGISNRSIYSGAKITWTITEPYYAKYWFPCKQYLTDKADSAYIFITVPDSLMAGSNGILINISSLPDHKKKYEWKTRYPIAFYLISISVANYLDYSFYANTTDEDSVLVQNFIYNDSTYFQDNKANIDSTKALMTSLSKYFGPYPFKKEKYGHSLAPAGGGMENQTMTTLSSFNFELVAHELAHQWFGDNVTCSDWQNIWINEGFASYGELLAHEANGTKEDVQEWLNWSQTSAKTATEGSIYVPLDKLSDTKRIFDHPLTYKKGALIIHMIRYIINNDELFFSILQEFQSRFADSTASAEDFKNLVEEKSSIDFDSFFQQWFYGEGFPTLKIKWEQIDDTIFIYIDQLASAPAVTPFFEIPMDFRLEYFGGDTTVQLNITQVSQKHAIPCSLKVYNIITDPDQWILKNVDGAHRVLPDNPHAYFSVFPNPANNEVYIQNLEIGKPFKIKIYDLNGILRVEKEGRDAFTIVNLENFESGVYQIVISNYEFKETYQLVKT